MPERKKDRQERLRSLLLEEKRRLWSDLRGEFFRNQENLADALSSRGLPAE